ncbi:hypothetical protein GCM10011504_20160 [Siccirubricoccus deserti]|uniref:Uncharacterized protein n=1 Tax=Siccirubricoccus deserti TaxID=2013562 RepID=A0A9X0QX41_9PROT|nr:hypothetical protein [Siccirubricoccus deserti]MBC4015439.1 hypothetical protein [Siccirubricoccus deserti]GGC41701.1 hypothetical protein GCM10011504_20160 [Siccirubricoccus deserti]
MPRTINAERQLLTEAEFAAVAQSHHPAIRALDTAALAALEQQLTEMHDRARDLIRQRRRDLRGKAVAPGTGPAPAEPALPMKKQAFAAALKRVAREQARRVEG